MDFDNRKLPRGGSLAGRMRATIKNTKRRGGNQAGRPTAEELERRKECVMEVATEFFIAQGFAATSLIDIAKDAGVATRTLYQHFGDKEALFRDVIFARIQSGAIARPTVEDQDTLSTALLRAGRYAYAVIYRNQSIGLMRLIIAESQRFPDLMQSVATSMSARFKRNFEKLFISLEANGLIPASDHVRSAELFIDLALGNHPIITYTNWNAQPPSAEDLEERVNLFILGRYGSQVAELAQTRQAKVPKTK